MAAIFGAPVMEPQGNRARSTSSSGTSGASASTVEVSVQTEG